MNQDSIERDKYGRLARINEFLTYGLIISGLLIIQLPLPVELNKNLIYVLALLSGAFTILWHKAVPRKYSGLKKNILESLVGFIGLFLVVAYTGGIKSYFYFLYFPSVLGSAVYMPFRVSIMLTSIISLLTLGLALSSFNTNQFFGNMSIAALQIWGIWLISAYGRALSSEINTTVKKKEETKVEEIHEVDKLKDEFIFIISHELRTPITVIRGYIELLIFDPTAKLNKKMRTILEKAFITSNNLTSLVSILLEIARIETGKIRLYIQPVSIKDSVEKVLYTLEMERKEKNIDLEVKVESGIKVKADSERLEEIFNIILGNAITYTPEFGKVRFDTKKNSGHVEITISDNGTGMSTEIVERLYEKFYSEETNLGNKSIKGINIGMYVVKQLLSKMEGKISVDSKLGEGTTFTITLPSTNLDP